MSDGYRRGRPRMSASSTDPFAADPPSAEELAAALDCSADGVLLLDAARRVRFANATAATLCSLSGVAMRGSAVADVFPDAARAALVAALERARAGGPPEELTDV